MAAKGPLKGLTAWLIHRLVANYWSLPLVAILAAPVIAGLVIWADRTSLGRWIYDNGLNLLVASDTAQDLAIAVVSLNAAFLTLYWSVTLIVLTLATGNLGVRLVDRWLDKGLVRLSMAGLTFTLVFSVIVLARLDPEAQVAELPHFALLAVFGLQLVNIAMLGVAIHDLGRTMFVDRSISHLGTEGSAIAIPVRGETPHEGPWAATLSAPREGYIEGVDLEAVGKRLAMHEGHVRFCAAPGQHVLKGEPLIRFENPPPKDDKLVRAIAIGDYRSGVESTVFQVRLLVEVAARALSPGINDFYTAIACADQIAEAIFGHAETWVEDGEIAVYAPAPRFELPGQDFRGLFDEPLNAFRQAACDYPSVAIRMIDNYARLITLLADDCPPTFMAHLERLACELCDHAQGRAQLGMDKDDIAAALARVRECRSAQKC